MDTLIINSVEKASWWMMYCIQFLLKAQKARWIY